LRTSFPNKTPAISKLELVLDIYPSLSLILRYIYCLVFQGASSEKRKWLTEYTTRQNTTMSLRRVTLRPGLAENLITGQILPVSLFNTSLLPW
ncbi:hypothetical protein U9028_21705, partial [Escherichia coli]